MEAKGNIFSLLETMLNQGERWHFQSVPRGAFNKNIAKLLHIMEPNRFQLRCFWFTSKYKLGQKYCAPQDRPNQRSNS